MSQPSFPPRLIDAADDAAVRDALSAAKSDSMDPSRAMRALSDFQATKAAGSSAGVARQAARWKWALFAKVPASLALLCAIGVGWTAWPKASDRAMGPTEPTATPAATVEKAPETSPAPSEPPFEASIRVEDLPSAPMANEKRNSAAKTDSSFNDELAIMESARAALSKNDTDVCIRALDRYERRFPHGMFAEEAPVMRLEALVARGDRDRARSLGESILAKNPDGPHASRIRSLLASIH
ncbi:hypothetical protein AKJ09_01484 [Labilithrix luteola]|uniref:Outer membrane lipoprotein BamD-like domain-containing protein n=1 Tax=Labilithrix luteola TaxID=1391654 RepID=A0A0K1PMR0_9BACT|nr:hypothetical protein [Labilithrix luteola]AKU94820.1 hypothetical protein AKJ09_01484 [Labilithrix luteola]